MVRKFSDNLAVTVLVLFYVLFISYRFSKGNSIVHQNFVLRPVY